MRIDVFTLFPQLVDNFCSESLLGRARNEKLVDVRSHDLREHTTDVHHSVDDAPFGGGAGMVLRAEPVFESFEKSGAPRPLLLLSPGGKPFDQAFANKLASLEGFSLLCGRYEGVDHRIREHLVDEEVSVGDVVLAGGEVGACLIIEAVTRLLPGVMGNAMSPITESFGASGLLEEPQWTRPAEFRGWAVPEILRGGDHAKITRWRRAQALWRTLQQRPDIIEARGGLTEEEKALLEGVDFSSYPSLFASDMPEQA
jgi:tRNA (guanine37-N1)-methyltransferase